MRFFPLHFLMFQILQNSLTLNDASIFYSKV